MSVSVSELEELLDSVARIIDRYGDAYWPIFERLELELEERQSRQARLQARIRNSGERQIGVRQRPDRRAGRFSEADRVDRP